MARLLLSDIATTKNPMKIPTTKLAILCTAVCAAMLAFTHNASASGALTIGDTHTLGYVNYGVPSGDQDRENYVNHLVYMYNNGIAHDDNYLGQSYDIVNGSPHFGATLPNAIWAMNGGPNDQIDLGSTAGTYNYLFAKYDNTAAGSVVWYVGNLTGIITIPQTWGQYGLSGWTLFGPGGAGAPDGGTTVMLLGAALGTLGMARRFLKR